jgi:hypothetical protein
MKRPTIADAKRIAESTGTRAVVILAFTDGVCAGASYGNTKEQCDKVAFWMDQIIDDMSDGYMESPLVEDCPWPGITQD